MPKKKKRADELDEPEQFNEGELVKEEEKEKLGDDEDDEFNLLDEDE